MKLLKLDFYDCGERESFRFSFAVFIVFWEKDEIALLDLGNKCIGGGVIEKAIF